MRIIGLCVMCVWLEACSATSLFPPEIMKNVETDTFDFKAWKEQSYHPSGPQFTTRKVELGGQIMTVIRKPEGVVIFAEEQPIEKYPGYGPRSVRREGSFSFAIAFNGFPDPSMLQAGNQLVAIGRTDGASIEIVGGTPRVLPHLAAQCLHIWNTQGIASIADFAYEGAMGYYPPEERTYCRVEETGGNITQRRSDR